MTTIGEALLRTGTGEGQGVVSSDGVNWLTVPLGARSRQAVLDAAEWHFASTQDVAVAVGPDVETDDPMAMVSVRK